MQPTVILNQKIDALRPQFLEMVADRCTRFQQIRARLVTFASPQDPAGPDEVGPADPVGTYAAAADPADPPAGTNLMATGLPVAGFAATRLARTRLVGTSLPAANLPAANFAGASLPVLLDDLCFGAHRIVGVAATFGFSTLGSLAWAVERMRRPSSDQDPRAAELLAELLAALDDLLAEMTRVLRQAGGA